MSTKQTDNKDHTLLKVAGQVLQMVWQSSGAKLFLYLILIVCFFGFLFSFRMGIGGIVLLVIALGAFIWWVSKFLMNLAHTNPALFQDSKTWYLNQRLLVGNKSTGLHELPQETVFVQPVFKNLPGDVITEAKKDHIKVIKEGRKK